jgi:HEAT repeat protein
MPKEQLLGLAADVDRLLAAGVGVADGDSLRRREKTLRELGKKVPALVPVADAVQRVTGATTPGPAFLDLLVMMRQVRASLAATAVEGPLTPLPESGPWQSSVPVRDLLPVYEALTQTGSGREQQIKDAVERKLFGDLRLVTPMLAALGDTYAPVADLVAESGLPSAGHGVLAELQPGLNLNGKAADARRLRSLCRVDPETGAALCRVALNEGSVPLRVEALHRLAGVAGAHEAQKAGMTYREDRNRDVRTAAMIALQMGSGDEVLEILIAGLGDKEHQVTRAATSSLGAMDHPNATERLLKELETALVAIQSLESKKIPTKAKPTKKSATASATTTDRAEWIARALRLMEALGERKDGDRGAVAAAILPLIRQSEPDLRSVAAHALGSIGPITKELVPALAAVVADRKSDSAEYAMSVLTKYPAASRTAAIPALLKLANESKADKQQRIDALQILSEHLNDDTRAIVKTAQLMLADKSLQETYGRHKILQAIGKMGSRAKELLPTVFDAFRSAKESNHYGYYLSNNVVYGLDPEGTESIPVLIGLLDDRKDLTKALALQALRAYGPKAKAAVPAIERLAESKDHNTRTFAEQTLQAIQ